MGNHPIESLMKTAMESIQQIVDVNTIVGDPVETPDGSVIIPISRVSCGFAAGGSEFSPPEDNKENANTGGTSAPAPTLPFGGGAGADRCRFVLRAADHGQHAALPDRLSERAAPVRRHPEGDVQAAERPARRRQCL